MKNEFDLLSEIPLFQKIEDDNRKKLLNALDTRRQFYTEREIILHTGETTGQFGVILNGCVQILKEDLHGNATLLAQLDPGESFAEAFVFAKIPLSVTVQAAKDCTVLWINYEKLHSLQEPLYILYSQMMENLMELFARKNVFLTGRIEHLSKRTLKEKVLSYLSDQAIQNGSNHFEIPLDRQGLADYLASDRSALSAVLCKLRDEGVLKFHKNQFTLL